MSSKHLILCHPLLLLPSIFPGIRVFPYESALHIRWSKNWSFSFSLCNEYSGFISFRVDWFDLLAVQGTLKSLLQHHSSKASILQQLAFFTVQLSHPYMTTGKTIALTGWTFVGKVISLLFNMVSRLVITFLPRNKHLLISWLQSLSTVILDPKKIKFATVSTFPLSICHEIMKVKKVVWQGCQLSPCLNYTLSTSQEMPGLDELQAGIRTVKRNINNLRYANDTTLMAESEEELKRLFNL